MHPSRTLNHLGQRPRVLDVAGVDKTFNGDVVALRRMSLSVNEGDFISLLGRKFKWTFKILTIANLKLDIFI